MHLINIHKDNWQTVVQLWNKSDKHVAPNLYSIAEAQFYPKANSKAIEVNGEIIGYVMYGEDEDDATTLFIDRFMIAKGHRRKGYGRQAIQLLIDIWQASEYQYLKTSTDPDNLPMQALIKQSGFTTNGDMLEGEIVYFIER